MMDTKKKKEIKYLRIKRNKNLNFIYLKNFYQRINKIRYKDKEVLSEQVDNIINKVIKTQEIRINKLNE
ncbi:hypothetical protein EDI_317120 [Entamoeba dispar SAW760]|uniref:Uncharacterized protein n=1 Tax=Entamoeba dispar (strain ATCC PRA-260 / SAW760) TaxID=370354 RepID=B0EB38_ENTDS|nr:uncharacterized protein EDI_317120 [Entamoeba dispar SAW760]EDR28255.1 hypothetical protein EDI_317120 [Entamoeba dispar SAW760]|eukprot:EDR28255.1 hypothetical protein EDI_317120 [Entamoeba dispar SAW760]